MENIKCKVWDRKHNVLRNVASINIRLGQVTYYMEDGLGFDVLNYRGVDGININDEDIINKIECDIVELSIYGRRK
jgi:hypothetical protein